MKIINRTTVFALGAALVLALGAIQDAHGAPVCDATVVGQNNAAVDVAAVNGVVNGPQTATVVTVCLKGTFDFGAAPFNAGNPGFVGIDPVATLVELNILGVDSGGNKATILGGFESLRFLPGSVLPRLSIKNLRFQEPLFTAISVFRGNERIVISDVDVDGVLTTQFNPTTRIREGIAFTSVFAEIAGEIEISDNTIDGGVYDGTADLTLEVSTGIALFGSFVLNPFEFSAKVTVLDNVVTNWSGNGIQAINLTGATIKGNTIKPGSFANSLAVCAAATGQGSVNGISLAGVENSLVQSNTIVMEPALTGAGASPACAAGVILLGNTVPNVPNRLLGDALGNEFKGNNVQGEGTYAILVGLPILGVEENNRFHDNNLTQFTPSGAWLLLDAGANGNTFQGKFPSVSGNVAGNSITGY